MWTAWPSVSIVPSFSIIFYPIKLRGGGGWVGCEYAGEADTLVNCYLMNKVRINSANSYRWKLSPHYESFSWNLFWNLRIFFTPTVFPNGANELSALLWWLPCRVPYLQNNNIKEQSVDECNDKYWRSKHSPKKTKLTENCTSDSSVLPCSACSYCVASVNPWVSHWNFTETISTALQAIK